MNTGIHASDEVIGEYEKLSKKREYKAIILKIEGTTTIVEKVFPTAEFKFEDFVNAFPEGDCRIGVLEYEHHMDDGRTVSKIFSLLWCPLGGEKKEDGTVTKAAKPMDRMKYSGSFNAINDDLKTTSYQIQCDRKSDITEEKLAAKMS